MALRVSSGKNLMSTSSESATIGISPSFRRHDLRKVSCFDRLDRADKNSPTGTDNRGVMDAGTQRQLRMRLHSLRSGLKVRNREHRSGDSSAFAETLSVLLDEIAEIEIELGNSSP